MSNRLKSSSNRIRSEHCGRRNQLLTLQTVTLDQGNGQQEDLQEMLCPSCRQKLINLISKNYDLQFDHVSTAVMYHTEYNRRVRNLGTPPKQS